TTCTWPTEGRAQMPGNAGVEPNRFLVRLSVEVHAPAAPPPETRGLTAGVAGPSGGVGVRHGPQQGRGHGPFDKEKEAAQVPRAVLLDRAAVSEPAAAPPVPRARLFQRDIVVTIAHQVPGRVRLRLEPGKDNVEGVPERVAARLSELPGVLAARPSVTRGSVVVKFTPDAISVDKILTVLGTGLPENAPEPEPLLTPTQRQLIKMGCTAAVFGVALTGLLPLPIVLAAVTLTGIPSFSRAIESARQRQIKVDHL